MKRFHFALLALALLVAQPLVAATYYVGSCHSKAFSTISAAVEAVPAGSTIEVCPGTYAEQVVIDKALTVKGISYNNSSQPVIVVPSGGLATTSSISYGTVAAQVEVTAGPVNITNITVDGTAASTNCPSVDYIGILYSSGSSGTVNEVETRNQNCGSVGIGIVAENGAGATQTVTIQNSNVNTNNYAGITVESNQIPPSLTAVIKNNWVTGSSNGIMSSYNPQGSISNNVIEVGLTGVYSGTANVAVSGNTVAVSGNTVIGGNIGIDITGTAVSITSNRILNSARAGVYVEVGGITVKNNTITQVPVGIEFNCITDTNGVTGNTINGATTGIDMVPAGYTGTNKFYNVSTLTTGGCSSE